ncbi:unnamed protein product [Cuscuta epithymum]|uniref:YqaJ viral recombinase domain-containing protein n=1 Tax=Cuscuta epithymum TaxID=186058 RepID=A0AAV0CDQ2_9ASTE|nr:unnamed protein product [Cuscuta epithymum]
MCMCFAGVQLVCYSKCKCFNVLKEFITSSHSYHCKRLLSCSVNHLENYRSIVESSSLQNRFKNWQHLRKGKLTASTFSQAIGFWPHRRVQLWKEKIGHIEPFYGNFATCWSNIKEEEALESYKLITGNYDVSMVSFQVRQSTNPEEDEWLAASPDGVINGFGNGLPSSGVLEIKCPYFGGDMSVARPFSRIPLYYIPQAQGLMEILNLDWLHLYIWTTKGSSLFIVYRDKKYWEDMEKILSDFWWNYVQPAKKMYDLSSIRNPLEELKPLGLFPGHRHDSCGKLVCESSRIALNDSKLLLLEIDGKVANM